tara:strand:- start:94 stop:516 length:423 start_codon:yes stop_codon:yes gene_type:complete
MKENYKILGQYIKDMSSETPNLETYLFVRDYIFKYQLNIEINSKALKDKIIEINTILKFEDKDDNKKKAYFEITYATIIKVNDDINDKKILAKIVLSDVQNKIYPDLEKSFLNMLHNSGYPGVQLEKKIDFEKLYNEKFN